MDVAAQGTKPPSTAPAQNQPAVPEPVDHYEKEIRIKPPAVPTLSLAPFP